jgi:putative phosphotransacetylase
MSETKVLINLSNRHIHLSQEDLKTLFNKDSLSKTKDLLQPGQFATEELVAIKGPKGQIEKVRVLGPVRKETQCEILASDQFKLGAMGCAVRESGHLDGSFPMEVIGPAGSVKKERGLIIAKRHIHMTPADAANYGVADKETVELEIEGERGAVFKNVVIRVSPSFALECHLDFDEGNAVGIGNGSTGIVRKHK